MQAQRSRQRPAWKCSKPPFLTFLQVIGPQANPLPMYGIVAEGFTRMGEESRGPVGFVVQLRQNLGRNPAGADWSQLDAMGLKDLVKPHFLHAEASNAGFVVQIDGC
jgi:hypothetical protein